MEASGPNSAIQEFIDIIKELNNRLEDVVLELQQFDIYLKGK